MAICIQSSNQSLLAVYLRFTDAAERVVEILAHMGISVSVSSTNNAINSLSAHSGQSATDLGATLTAAQGYDNIAFLFMQVLVREAVAIDS
jgi:hypothetical protein